MHVKDLFEMNLTKSLDLDFALHIFLPSHKIAKIPQNLKGPLKYYVSTGLGEWVDSEIGHFCLVTVQRDWVGDLENPPNMLT